MSATIPGEVFAICRYADVETKIVWVEHGGQAKAFACRFRPSQGHEWTRSPSHDLPAMPVRVMGDMVWLAADDVRIVAPRGISSQPNTALTFDPDGFFEAEAQKAIEAEEAKKRAAQAEANRLANEAKRLEQAAKQAKAQAKALEATI